MDGRSDVGVAVRAFRVRGFWGNWGAETLFLDGRFDVGVAVRPFRISGVHLFQAGCLKYVMAAMLGTHCTHWFVQSWGTQCSWTRTCCTACRG